MADKYRWSCPQDWLMEKMEGMDRGTILANLRELVSLTDADKLQEVFQSEMDGDGYFKPVREAVPALLVLHPTTGAIENTLVFCSEACRRVFETDEKVDAVVVGGVHGATCEECGNLI